MLLKKQKFIKIVLTFLSIVFISSVFLTIPTLAQSQEGLNLGVDEAKNIGLGGGDIRVTIAKIIRVALGLLGIIALVISMYGGFVYMTAGGNDEKLATGKKILVNGVIGLAIILSSYAIVSFVISKLMTATGVIPAHCYNKVLESDLGEDAWYQDIVGGQACSNDGNPCRSCTVPGGDCPWCDGANAFYMRSVPGGGQKCVSNLKLSIDFNKELNLETLKIYENEVQTGWKIKILEDSTDIVAEGNWVCGNSGDDCKEIIFEPSGACDAGCEADGCLKPDTNYTLKFPSHPAGNVVSIKSVDDLPLICNSSRLRNACDDIKFITGSACDTENPVIEITFPKERDSLESRSNIPVIIEATDDTGIDKIKLYVVGETYPVNIVTFSGCQTSINETITWQTPGVGDYTLQAWGFDQAYNNSSYNQKVKVSPIHCFNQICDEGEDCWSRSKEPPIDCGGECRSCSGSSCESDIDCFSGYCDCGVRDDDGECTQEGVCLDKTKITNVNPLAGALGTFVSVSGYYFGDKVGDIYFASTTNPTVDDWEKAELANCGEGVDAWSMWQVIVASPLENGQTGPIKIIATSTGNDIPEEHRIDFTNNKWGLPISDFVANNEKRPGLCPMDPPTGTQKMKTPVTGQNFRDTRNASTDYVYFGNEATDGGHGKAKIVNWADELINLVVPGIGYGKVGVQVLRGGESSNVVSFKMIEEIDPTLPWIDNISPSVGAVGEYITITGKNFGKFVIDGANKSIVTFEEVGSDPAVVLLGSVDFPELCQGNVWNEKQVIIKFPEGGNIESDYIVKVTRGGDGEQSQLGVEFDLDNKFPGPGICNISPSSAMVPFKDGHYMSIVGEYMRGDKYDVDLWVENTKILTTNKDTTEQYGMNIVGIVGMTAFPGESSPTIFTGLDFSNDFDSYLEFEGSEDLSFVDEKFTIAFWMQLDEEDYNETEPKFGVLGKAVEYGIYTTKIVDGEGYEFVYLNFNSWGEDVNDVYVDALNLPLNSLHHFIWVADGEKSYIYKDGELMKVKDKEGGSNQMHSSNKLFRIGDLEHPDFSQSFPGVLGDIRVYDRALKSEEIESVFNGHKPETAGHSVYFWSSDSDVDVDDDNKEDRILLNGHGRIKALNISGILNELDPGQEISGIINNNTSTVSGPLIVERLEDGRISNPMNFELMDCVANNNTCAFDNQKCCSDGNCVLKTGLCLGETRSAGYMWRFSTKDIPPVPRVVESCERGIPLPTPAPNIRWKSGNQSEPDHQNVCNQALVTIEFSMPMATSTLDENSVIVRKCNDDISENLINANYNGCNSPGAEIEMRDAHGNTADYGVEWGTSVRPNLQLYPTAGWTTSTWYQVILTDDITSDGYEGNSESKAGLHKTRSCGTVDTENDGVKVTAYCFLFKTGDQDCELADIAILPYDYWTQILEKLIKHRTVQGEYDIYWKGTGISTQKCINMEVNGYDWEWSVDYATASTTGDVVTTTILNILRDEDGINQLDYSNIINPKRDYIRSFKNKEELSALGHTVAKGLLDINDYKNGIQTDVSSVYVHAKASTTTNAGIYNEHEDWRPLTVGAGEPKIIDYWPDCLEACTNAEVGVKFNTTMSTKNLQPFVGGVYKIEECLDENCFATIYPATDEDGNKILEQNSFSDVSSPIYTELYIANYGSEAVNLKPSTLYKVTISSTSTEDNILWSAAALNDLSLTAKPYNTEFTWRFRTKDTTCLVDRVDVNPRRYVAKSLTDKTMYTSESYSKPDECSTAGQRLNAWDNEWNWYSSNPEVATTSQYLITQKSNYCTDKCVLKGSDIPSDFANVVVPVCGNGKVEAGEDCDVPNKELGCGLDCLNTGDNDYTKLSKTPSSTNPGFDDVGKCGDGTVNTTSTQITISGIDYYPDYGEECDWAHTSSSVRHGCSQRCLREGSKIVTEAEDVEGSICGNGQLGAGEECELGIYASSTDPTSSYGCGRNCLHTGMRLSKLWCSDHSVDHGGFSTSSYKNACLDSYSQCGDGIRTYDEDIGCDGENGSWAPGGICVVSDNCDCDYFCLKIAPMECTPGEEGCSKNGTHLGSGLRFSEPSICGDGVWDVGEDRVCEEEDAYKTKIYPNPIIGPWVLAIAQSGRFGMSGTEKIEFATSSIVAEALGTNVKNGIQEGKGDFLIPCGFESDAECQAFFGTDPEVLKYGVGTNTCCFVRPNLIEKYPAPGDIDICPNTVIRATFDQRIDQNSLLANVVVAYGLTADEINKITPTEPVEINTPEIKTKLLSSVVVDRNYLYTVNSEDAGVVEIYNILDKKYPFKAGEYVSSTSAYNDIFVKTGFLFLAGNGYIDIVNALDSENSKFVKRLETGRNEKQVKVNGEYVYSLSDVGELGIWRMNAVDDLTEVSMVNTTGSPTDYITNFYFYKDYIITIHGYKQDFSDSIKINKISSLLVGDNLDISKLEFKGDSPDSRVINMYIEGDHIYFTKVPGSSEAYVETYKFNIVDGDFNLTAIQTNFNIPLSEASFYQKLYGGELFNDGDYIYRTYLGGVSIINISNTTTPTTTYSFSGLSSPKIKVFPNEKVLYIFNRRSTENELLIYDISSYTQPICDNDVTGLIQLAQVDTQDIPWYQNIWKRIVMFFKGLFGSDVMAENETIIKWCAGDEVKAVNVVNITNSSTSRIVIDLDKPLKADKKYAVILGNNIKDTRGVRIGKGDDGYNINWRFITGSPPDDSLTENYICTIDGTRIEPLLYGVESQGITSVIDPTEVFFTRTKVTTTLQAVVYTDSNQEIQTVKGYNWNYIWEPITNVYVEITATTSEYNDIQAKNQNGETDVMVTANVLAPNDYPDYKIGRKGKTGSAHITVFLCENPWPPIGKGIYNTSANRIFPYEDMDGNNDSFDLSTGQFTGNSSAPAVRGGYFNFKFYYCADSGLPGVEDDLPYLRPIVQPGTLCGNGVIDNYEDCDDGNSINGDGCNNTCQVTGGWECDTSEPSWCVLSTALNTDLNKYLNTYLTFFEKTKNWLRNLVVQDVYAANCTDDDGGRDYLIKGTVIDDDNPEGIEDYCYTHYVDGEIMAVNLFEGVCENDIYKMYQQKCSKLNTGGNLYICRDGACVVPICGDNYLDEGEECDDGNTAGDDGCDSECKIECGNGRVDEGEECDDGDEIEWNGCDNECKKNCSDTDGDLYGLEHYKIKGTVVDVHNPDGKDDFCHSVSTNHLFEMTCNGDELKIIQKSCTELSDDNYICRDGACVVACGNNQLDQGEECDGSLFIDNKTCTDFGFEYGDLTCSSDCKIINKDGCYTCGDDSISGDEVCDGSKLDDNTCFDFYDPFGEIYNSGELFCSEDCLSFSTSSCKYCGDGNCNETENWNTCFEDCDPPGLIGKALKRFIFTAENSGDAIGIQVFANPDHLTVSKWHQKNSEDAGSLPMQSLVVDKYDAVTDGNNIYIDALNYTGTSTDGINFTTGTMFSNIYLFSRNSGASAEMGNVFEQVMKNVQFNANLTNYGYCGSDVLNPDYKITCITDQDCPISCEDVSTVEECTEDKTNYPKVCSNQIDKIKRNYTRLRDLQKIEKVLESHAAYPDIVAYWDFDKFYDDNRIVDIVGNNDLFCGSTGCPTIKTESAGSITKTGVDLSDGKYLYIPQGEQSEGLNFTEKDSFTIMAWINVEDFQPKVGEGYHNIFTNSNKIGLGIDINNVWSVDQPDYKINSVALVERSRMLFNIGSLKQITANKWNLVTASMKPMLNSNSSTIKFYINNEEKYERVVSNNIFTFESSGTVFGYGSITNMEFVVGGKGDNDDLLCELIGAGIGVEIEECNKHTQSFNGTLNSLLIYNRALTDEEVKAHYFKYPDFSNRYPKVSEGSYLTGNTLSVWNQSWSKLSSELGVSLPKDPINKLGVGGSCLHAVDKTWVFCQNDEVCNETDAIPENNPDYVRCTFHDPVTGWSAEDRRFIFACDGLRSYAYRYTAKPDSALGYQINTNFEDFGLSNWDPNNKEDFLNAFRDPVRVYISNVCSPASGGDNELSSVSTGFCGDGKLNLNLDEVCDPPGVAIKYTETDCDGHNQYKLRKCANDCGSWNSNDTTCYDDSGELCGNGIVNAGEFCDDGVMNGGYNQCNLLCSGKLPVLDENCLIGVDLLCGTTTTSKSPGYCGDKRVNSAYELCDIKKNIGEHIGFCIGPKKGKPCDDVDDCNSYCDGEWIIKAIEEPSATTKYSYSEVGAELADNLNYYRMNPLTLSESTVNPWNIAPPKHVEKECVIGCFGDWVEYIDCDNSKCTETILIEGGGGRRDCIGLCCDGYIYGTGKLVTTTDASCQDVYETNMVYAVDKYDSCSWDCQKFGPYCGDGIVQSEYGEECDGNRDCMTDVNPSAPGTEFCSDDCRRINKTNKDNMFYLNVGPKEINMVQADELIYGDDDNVEEKWAKYWTFMYDRHGEDRLDRMVLFLPIGYHVIWDYAASSSLSGDSDLVKLCYGQTDPDVECYYEAGWMTQITYTSNTDVSSNAWKCVPKDIPEPIAVLPVCGNRVVDEITNEVCDTGALNGVPCDFDIDDDGIDDRNYCTYCSWDCSEILDKYQITGYLKSKNCGDGIVQGGYEQCDPGSIGGFSETCDSDCTFSVCGDGKTNHSAGESCDTGERNGVYDCDYDQDRYTCIACDSNCKYMYGKGSYCGDGDKDYSDGEICDTNTTEGGLHKISGMKCTDFDDEEFTNGTVSCADDCQSYDTNNCYSGECGDGVVEEPEECDYNDYSVMKEDYYVEGTWGLADIEVRLRFARSYSESNLGLPCDCSHGSQVDNGEIICKVCSNRKLNDKAGVWIDRCINKTIYVPFPDEPPVFDDPGTAPYIPEAGNPLGVDDEISGPFVGPNGESFGEQGDLIGDFLGNFINVPILEY